MSICRNICASGWRQGQRPRAISSSRSTSIRRAFCSSPAVIASEAKQSTPPRAGTWTASSRSLSSGAHSRDPLAPRNDAERASKQKGLPSFSTAGLCCRDKFRDRYATQRILENGASGALLGNDLGGDVADAGAGQSDGTGSARGEVEHASLDEGTTVIDRDDDALAAIVHPELGSEWQRAVSCGHGVLVEALSGSGLAAGFIAVKRCLSREAAPRTLRADRGIGVEPAAVGLRVLGVVAMVPGFGRSLGDAATDQESC